MLDREIKGVIHEDNMSTIEVIKTGYSAKLRHVMPRHYRTSLGIVHEMCQDPMITVGHIPTDEPKGDLMTKGLARPKHDPACKLVGLYPYILSLPCTTDQIDPIESYVGYKAHNHAMCTILDRAAKYAGG